MKKLLIIIFILSLCVTFAEAQRPKVDEITAREKITTPMLKSGVDTVIKGSGVMADSIRLNGQWLKEWSLSIGSGTQNYLTKWGANNTLTQGIAQDNGTTFLINGFLNSNNFKTNATSKSIKIGYTVNSSEEETSENYNLYLGEQAGNSITTGASNINIGYQAGYTNTTHGNNINIGSKAGYSSNIGKNIYIGDQAGYSNTTGQNNINIGLLTGYNITQGSYNTLIGNENGGTISYTSDNNTMIGYRCGVSLTSSTSGNTYIGSSVNSLGTTSGNATAIGFKSAFNGAGTSSIYFGSYAGYYITESNVLVIDNAQRTEGTKYTNPLIFGKFNASLGLQEFRINAKTFINGNLNYASNSDATDDYTASISQISIYQNGLIIYFMANIANTGACTINVNSLGAKALKMKHDQDPTNNYIEAGSIVHAIYDGTNFQMLQPAAN